MRQDADARVIPILDSRAMRRADRAAIRSGVASSLLMENAAEALVDVLQASDSERRRIVVVCGPGNNGGDGLAAARMLVGRGHAVSVFTLADPDGYRGDAAENADARAGGGARAREPGGIARSRGARKGPGATRTSPWTRSSARGSPVRSKVSRPASWTF